MGADESDEEDVSRNSSYSGESNPSEKGTSDDRSAVYREALTDTRNVIDVQFNMNENADEEILRVINVNLLILGGVATLITYLPDLMTEALPWIVISGLFFVVSITVSTYIYRDTTLYAGFGDHGFDEDEQGRIVPEKKYGYDFVIDTSGDRTAPDSRVEKDDPPSPSGFRASLLREHQAGINHNNIEIKYRVQIHQLVSLLAATGVFVLGLGVVTVLPRHTGLYAIVVSSTVTAATFVVGLYMILKLVGLLCVYTRSDADPGRLTYGYASDIRNRTDDPGLICSITMSMFSLDTEESDGD